jgi:serine/threonine protein kinase
VVAGAHFCGACGAPIVPDRASGEAADPYIGQTVKGTYFIQRRVGGGGMGDVYKAVHVALDKPVALKLLKKSLLADATLVQRFYREARAASKLRHPNVISVTDFGQTEDGTLFMAMEYLAGKSLARMIADDQPLSEKRIVPIGAQVLAALAEAHAAGILHRDLKPENVMVESRRDEPDSVKVLDFGIAKIQTAEADADKTQTELTQAGLVCGTPGYMSPEQWREETLDARSDLYATGVLLYEMLTGRLPFEAATPLELVRKQLAERPQPPSARRADRAVSDDLERLVMRALSPDRKDRPASAEEMRSDLLSCVLLPTPEAPGDAGDGDGNETVSLPRPPVRRVPSPPPSPRRTPGQGTGPRIPPQQTRAPTPPKEKRPRNTALHRPAATPSRAKQPHAMDVSAEAATIPSLKPQRLNLVAAVIAGAVALAIALGIAQWFRGDSAPSPDAGPAATPSPTPQPTLAPWLSSRLELVATPAPSPPAPDVTPMPEPSPTPRPIIPPARPTATLAPKPPRVQCATPLHYEHGLDKISTPPPASGEGVLVVRAVPWGHVFVCAAAYGKAPVELKVKSGIYQVRVDHGATSKRSQVVVEPGARASVAVDFSRAE